MRRKIHAVDFDGYLCRSVWPGLGKPVRWRIWWFKRLQRKGDILILWTCRAGAALAEAVEWCKQQGLVFDAVNENWPERVRLYGNDSRKIGADVYHDDKNGWI